MIDYSYIFTKDFMQNIFTEDRADNFFEALFGDASEGAYDIEISFQKQHENKLIFAFNLNQRPGRCFACNLTYGLPQVFSRHPIINLKGFVQDIEKALEGKAKCIDWEIGNTQAISNQLHVIPIIITIE